jgi:hypothetical protein
MVDWHSRPLRPKARCTVGKPRWKRLVGAGDKCAHPALAQVRGSAPPTPDRTTDHPVTRTGAADPALPREGASKDVFLGQFTGKHWLGPVAVEVQKEGESYVVTMNPASDSPLRGIARLDGNGAIAGEFVTRLLGVESKDTFFLRPEGDGLRFRTRGINIIVEPR